MVDGGGRGALVAVLWRAGRLVEVVTLGAGGPKPDGVAELQASLGLSFHITVGVMAVVFLGKLAVSAWRLAKAPPA